MLKKIRVNVGFTEEQFNRIENVSFAKGLNVTGLVRLFFLEKLKEFEKQQEKEEGKYYDSLYRDFLENSNKKNISLDQFKEALRQLKEEEYREAEELIDELNKRGKDSN